MPQNCTSCNRWTILTRKFQDVDVEDVQAQAMYLYIYADDTKLFRYISNSRDQYYMQSGINKVGDWANEWLLKLNVEKCCGMSFAANISNVCTTKYYRSG